MIYKYKVKNSQTKFTNCWTFIGYFDLKSNFKKLDHINGGFFSVHFKSHYGLKYI